MRVCPRVILVTFGMRAQIIKGIYYPDNGIPGTTLRQLTDRLPGHGLQPSSARPHPPSQAGPRGDTG